MKHIILLPICSFIVLLLTECNLNSVYENNKSIPNYVWDNTNIVTFEANITDTISLYDIFVNVRHAHWYPYRNLWIIVYTSYPSGEKKKDRVELPLGNAKGWYGDGMGDIWDITIPVQENVYFPKTGVYKFELEQNMREPKIPGIMEIGIRIEKTEKTMN